MATEHLYQTWVFVKGKEGLQQTLLEIDYSFTRQKYSLKYLWINSVTQAPKSKVCLLMCTLKFNCDVGTRNIIYVITFTITTFLSSVILKNEQL